MELIPNPFVIPVGIAIGILVTAPVGPVNVLCIQRAIERGFWGGVSAGMGAMLGDGLIALFAVLGIGAISGLVESHKATIQVVGGLALLAFGWKLYVTAPDFSAMDPNAAPDVTWTTYVWDIPKTFFLTITNPGAVLGLFAIFGGISTFVAVDSTVDRLVLVASVVAGSFVWWVGLSHFIGRMRHRLNANILNRINTVSGLVLVGFGLVLIGEIAWKWAGGAAMI